MSIDSEPPKEQEAILVVNDRQDQLLSLAAMIEPMGLTIVTADSGPAALRHMLRQDFAVMLLDVHMPGMDGFEIAEAIRKRPRTHLMPIIFASASHTEEFDSLRGYESGAFDYISMPVSPVILRAKVAAFLEIHRMHKKISLQAERMAMLNSELSHRNAALKVAQNAKDLLTSMIIHDLRNPLMACMSSLDLAALEAKKNGQQSSKYLISANKATDNMLELINSLLDITRMEDHRMPKQISAVDMDALISGKIEQYQSAALAAKVNLIKGFESLLGAFHTDETLLSRIIENIIVNAIKHTPEKGTVSIIAVKDDMGGLHIDIKDTGEGMPPEALGSIFKKYGRVEGQKLGRRYDTGLGLVFCRMAVELLGGTISVESEVGHGSTFVIKLPTVKLSSGNV